MKSTLLILILSIIHNYKTFGQINNWTFKSATLGLHLNSFQLNTLEASSVGIGFSGSINRFYYDIASNLASGQGEYLNFSSSYSYSANKISVSVFNVGYIFKYSRFGTIPFIGWGSSSEIFQDPIGWNTYFQANHKDHINLGIIGFADLEPQVRFQLGFGSFEKFKVGFSYIF